jgi:hypothetical protein
MFLLKYFTITHTGSSLLTGGIQRVRTQNGANGSFLHDQFKEEDQLPISMAELYANLPSVVPDSILAQHEETLPSATEHSALEDHVKRSWQPLCSWRQCSAITFGLHSLLSLRDSILEDGA